MIPLLFGIIDTTTSPKGEKEDLTWGRYSLFLHVLLPIAGLAFLWGQRGIFSKLLLQLDRSCISVYCPSLSKREKLLKWAGERLPSTWSSQARTLSSGIPELWKDGSLLCTLINSVVPGACPNPHRHWRKPPLHAQALAYKYLGLVPMFTEDQLCGDFTVCHERNFLRYLQKLQELINKWQGRGEISHRFSSQYVARGMGLCTGEQNRKAVFYLYANLTAQKRGNVLMYMRGPYGTQGKATISPFHNLKTIPVVNVLQNQLEATRILPFRNEEQKSFLKTISLDFTSLISNTEQEQQNEIPIQIDMEIDRAKVTYIPTHSGIYEISLICEGELLKGSPYFIRVSKGTTDLKDSFNTDCENVEEKITFTKRRVLSKVIDCIDEQICIDNNKPLGRSTESSTESENDDLTITAITKKNDEILKTEINCALEDIMEEISNVQDKTALDQIETEQVNKEENDNHVNGLLQLKIIAEQLKNEMDSVDGPVAKKRLVRVDSRHKLVKDGDEIKTEIVQMLQNEILEEFDNKMTCNVEPNNANVEESLISKIDIGIVKSTKYLKNFVNSTSKQEMLNKVEDENNNSPPLKRINSKIYFEVSPKKFSKTSCIIASPICPDHIDPEVEPKSLNQLTWPEKRKMLQKQDTIKDVTFSVENDDPSKSKDFSELSVLNVLDTIRRNSYPETSLATAVSLPNITDSSYEQTFKERKDYWERLSSRSSSSVSLNSEQSKKKASNKVEPKKPVQKSLDNLTKIEPCFTATVLKTFDHSLEDCSIIPLEDRKKQLLKNMYEQERPKSRKFDLKKIFKKHTEPKTEEITTEKNDSLQTWEEKKSTKDTIKFQFKKAINFFRSLESNSSNNKKEAIKRRHSLEIQKKNRRNFRGGSLNLPNVSDRFAINNLYKDVFGNRRGSFKGIPNKSEVVKSLASFADNSKPQDLEAQEENNISFNLFVNRAKNKKRKSIKTAFDLNY